LRKQAPPVNGCGFCLSWRRGSPVSAKLSGFDKKSYPAVLCLNKQGGTAEISFVPVWAEDFFVNNPEKTRIMVELASTIESKELCGV